ncbi:MAG: efflux RND transporter permease subunit, partial [Candidatus Methylomirabilis sp.]|nr:efflux RND transporter permease subunit [Deltaproteobacteria bacterium]
MARFFIDRPVFAAVVSIFIMLAGLAAMANLPVEQFPEIAPPEVRVVALYPGASADEVDRIVASPIQKQINGVQGMLYQKSQSSNDGRMILTVTFETGADLDIAQVEIQNRIALAEPQLPQEVVRQGITVQQVSSSLLMVLALRSTDGRYGDLFLANYANLNIVEPLQRIRGAGDVLVFGSKDYSMRLWLNPDRLAQLGLTAGDVAAAVREQNSSFPAGRIGQEPTNEPTELTLPVIAKGRFTEEREFEDVILRASPDGSIVRFRDVGRVELGAQSYDQSGRLSGAPTTFMLLYLRPGANSLETIREATATLDDLATRFPPGVEYVIPYDTTKFVSASIDEVRTTLLEALGLVVLVVFVFLQTWRATVITAVAIPVSLIGTFAGMYLLGFTINTLTLFGMVLAIGIVVDDAILVVENVERTLHDEALSVRDAVKRAMSEVSGPIVASVLVLASVFVPVGFLGGITGRLYKQFAITISVSVAVSGLVALTLTPALSALLMRRGQGLQSTGLFGPFNRGLARATGLYVRALGAGLRRPLLMTLAFAGVLGGAFALYRSVPASFLPPEDQGYLFGVLMLPEGASKS